MNIFYDLYLKSLNEEESSLAFGGVEKVELDAEEEAEYVAYSVSY